MTRNRASLGGWGRWGRHSALWLSLRERPCQPLFLPVPIAARL
jgi:hypothetical protein